MSYALQEDQAILPSLALTFGAHYDVRVKKVVEQIPEFNLGFLDFPCLRTQDLNGPFLHIVGKVL